MQRFIGMGLLATASLTLGAAGCVANGFAPIAVTHSASAVASCQAMGDVQASTLTPDSDVQRDLTQAARNKGANTLLVQSDSARTGTSYHCSMPETASAQKTSSPGR